MEKTHKEIAVIAKDIVNLLAKNKCTIVDADNALRIAKCSIDSTSTVQSLKY